MSAFGSAFRTRLDRYVLLFALLLVLPASPAQSHDPSAWGGLFRSRDYGATWVSANRGQFVSGAIALAISPTDVNHLLLGTESGLLRSRNGGRDWTIEAPTAVVGAVFALAFANGQDAVCSTGLGIFLGEGANNWRQVASPQGSAPARAIARSREAGRVYMAGWTGLFRSDDGGRSWSSAAEGLTNEPATALLVVAGSPEILYAIVRGDVWASVDGARSWTRRSMPPRKVDALTVDPTESTRIWAAGGDRLFRSDDRGVNWQGIGGPFPEPDTRVYGIAVSEEAIVATTDRGLYRSIDRGEHWALVNGNLPAHLEAGPLVRDPVDPATLYAGFSLIPYAELWRRAADSEGALTRISATSVVAGIVFLAAVVLAAFAALRRLGRYYQPITESVPAASGPRRDPVEKLP